MYAHLYRNQVKVRLVNLTVTLEGIKLVLGNEPFGRFVVLFPLKCSVISD